MIELKDLDTIVKLVSAILGLPAAAWGAYKLFRYWRGSVREEDRGLEGLDRERAYLSAHRNYLEDLGRALGYSKEDYTTLEGVFVEEERILSLRFLFRTGSGADQGGLAASDIRSTAKDPSVDSVFQLLAKATDPIILLGEPGSGKSVTMRQLALETAERELERKGTWPVIPIYLQLGSYTQMEGEEPAPVIEFIKYQLLHVIPGGVSIADSIERILTKGRAVVLLDSMDEMPSSDYSKRSTKLKEFLLQYGELNRIVVACRKREYTGAFPHAELVIQPFDANRVRLYLETSWVRYSRHFPELAGQEEVRDRLLDIARQAHPLSNFASNPFALNLLTRFFFRHRGTLPDVQAEIFQSYLEEKLQREESRNNLQRFEKQDLKSIWSGLAYGIIDQDLGTYVTPAQAVTLPALRARDPRRIEDAISIGVECRLLRQESDGSLRFEHHRLLEYLAAAHWEAHGADRPVEWQQLQNPWWRETLILRAGITRDPDGLVQEIVGVLDFSGFATASLTERLDRLFAAEVALVCARERWGELSGENQAYLLGTLADSWARYGTTLEQVRLVRALRGLPLASSYQVLAILAGNTSDWLVDEVFGSIDPRSFRSAEFAMIVRSFLRSTSAVDLFHRVRVIRSLSLVRCLRVEPEARKAFMLGLGQISVLWGSMALLCVLSRKFKTLDASSFDPTRMNTSGGFIRALIGVMAVLSLLLWMAGWRLTLTACLFGAVLSLATLPRTAFRYFFVTSLYFCVIGEQFRRAKWIRQAVLRALALFHQLSYFFRFCVTYLFVEATIILAWHIATGGSATPRYAHVGGGALIAVGINALVDRYHARRVELLLGESTTYLGEEKLQQFLDRSLAELRMPRPDRLSRRILNRLVELPIDEIKLITMLKQLADSGEFFLNRDDILVAIDRADVRRRHGLIIGQEASPQAGSA